jgi:hypothetical protein
MSVRRPYLLALLLVVLVFFLSAQGYMLYTGQLQQLIQHVFAWVLGGGP